MERREEEIPLALDPYQLRIYNACPEDFQPYLLEQLSPVPVPLQLGRRQARVIRKRLKEIDRMLMGLTQIRRSLVAQRDLDFFLPRRKVRCGCVQIRYKKKHQD